MSLEDLLDSYRSFLIWRFNVLSSVRHLFLSTRSEIVTRTAEYEYKVAQAEKAGKIGAGGRRHFLSGSATL